MKSRNVKRALVTSALALVMCISMLVGSTYAWFTDSVTSSDNKIKAGKLEIQLLMDGVINETADYTDISESPDPIFGSDTSLIAQNNNADTLWEPGKTQVAYLAIKNNGNLALKYKVALDVTNVAKNLYEVMEYAIVPNAKDTDTEKVTGWTTGNSVVPGIQTVSDEVSLPVGATHYFALVIHMNEEAGNEYQEGQVNFDMTVLATQDTVEADAFNNQYDKLAPFAYEAKTELKDGQNAVELQVRDENEAKVASFIIPAGALENKDAKATVTNSEHKANITVAAGSETEAFEIKIEGLKANNTEPVKAALRIAAGLDPATVKLYHYNAATDTEELIPCTYNPTTGYVTFESTSFSPFTVEFDAESVYVPPVVPDGKEHPVATVTEMTVEQAEEEVGEVEWGGYGQWSPTEGLDAELDAVYKFACTETAQEAANGPFANWACDFYLKLDRDLGPNQIFLGGNYGDFGWIGFHNGDVTLAANEELPLLGSVTTNAWKYADVASFVGTFYCGAGDVDDALKGATLTVMLRVTNPETGVSYNVETINHTF